MSIQKKHLENTLYSIGGILVLAALLVICNQIFRPVNLRLDCTEDKLYTLSNGTLETLKKLDQPVSIRFYYSKDVAQMPVYLKTYAGRVEDLLGEYKRNAGKYIQITKLNPKPDSDAEDSASLDGVSGQPLDVFGMEDKVYLGIAISCAGRLETLPFLSPERESLLEYDITRALISVASPVKAKLGIMSPLKVMGGIDNPQMMMQGQGGMKPAWLIVSELKKTYEVVEVPMDSPSIPEDITVLVAIHPANISETGQFAIDQFILRGGHFIGFLDAMNMTEMNNRPQQMQYMPPPSSSLPTLLKAWNIGFDADKVVVDRSRATTIRRGAQGGETMATVLTLGEEDVSADDPTTTQISSLLLFNTGCFTGTPADGLEKTVLLQSTADSETIEKYMAQRSGEDLLKEFKADGLAKELVIRLTGTFKTAYPDGAPVPEAKEGEETKAPEAPEGGWLKESVKPGAVVLLADADMLYDPFCVQKRQFMGQTLIQPFNHNLAFAQNLVEFMAGDNALFSIRSRSGSQRPFSRVRDMELAANDRFQEKIKQLEAEVQDIQQQINALQRKRDPGERELLSSEQRELLKQFRKREAEAKKSLKEERKKLRQDIDALENNLMLANIALVPCLVALGGIVLALVKHGRRVRR